MAEMAVDHEDKRRTVELKWNLGGGRLYSLNTHYLQGPRRGHVKKRAYWLVYCRFSNAPRAIPLGLRDVAAATA